MIIDLAPRRGTPADPAWASYSTTVLHFDGGCRIDLREEIGPAAIAALKQAGLPRQFAVITAFNPRGRSAAHADNQARHGRLLGNLSVAGIRWHDAAGASPDGVHREEGVAVALSPARARKLAIKYEQSAWFWFDGRQFWIRGALVSTPPIRLPADAVTLDAAVRRRQSRTQRAAAHWVASLSPGERQTVAAWFAALLDLRAGPGSAIHKVRKGIVAAYHGRIPLILLAPHARTMRRLAWTDRSWSLRAAGIAAMATATTVGGKAAGSAAFGTAIAIPLWVLFGSGAAVAVMIVREAGGRRYRAKSAVAAAASTGLEKR